MKRCIPLLLAALVGCATQQGASHSVSAAAGEGSHPAPPSQPAPPAAIEAPTVPAPVASTPVHVPTLREFAEWNDIRLLDVYTGMTKKTVESTMATAPAGRWRNPQKRQILHTIDGKVYEVLFYLTRLPSKERPITEIHMTPVIFHGGKVAAIGRYQLKKLRRRMVY